MQNLWPTLGILFVDFCILTNGSSMQQKGTPVQKVIDMMIEMLAKGRQRKKLKQRCSLTTKSG